MKKSILISLSLLIFTFNQIIAQNQTVNGVLTINTGGHNTVRVENNVAGEEATIRLRSKPSNGANWLHSDISSYATGTNTGFLGFKVPAINSFGIDYKMIINNDGKVGIGTTSPNNILHVVSTDSWNLPPFRIGSNDGNEPAVDFRTGTGAFGIAVNNGSINAFKIFHGVSENSFVIKSSGKVGIGTDLPFENLSNKGLQIDNGGHTSLQIGDGINDGGMIQSSDNRQRIFIGSNIYDAPSGSWQNFKSGMSAAVDIIGDAGTINFLTSSSANGYSSSNVRMKILPSGNVGIGTSTPQSRLAVNGQIRATEVKVLADISVPDYVFEPDYELRTLKETKEYIAENKHLPEIPSAAEIGENGIDLGDMNMRLLKKIEELTLYQIELLERLEKLETKNARIDELEKKIELLNKN